MADYYLDIETYTKDKVDLTNDPIITINYQQIDSRNGQPKDELKILKTWESSEQIILKQFYEIFKPEDKYNFVPIGCYISTFDLPKLYYRWRSIGVTLSTTSLFFDHPYLDLKAVLVMLNGGTFKGANLEKFAGKVGSGSQVKELYEAKNYEAITEYVKGETESFLKLYQFLIQKMNPMWQEFAKQNGIIV
jgi:hypothetical protein